MARDYLTLKLWDVRKETKPVQTIEVHEHLRSKLCDLYENDCIFDKFECACSLDGRYRMFSCSSQFVRGFISGSYDDRFFLYDSAAQQGHLLRAQRATSSSKSRKVSTSTTTDLSPLDCIDFTKKSLHVDWHPSIDLVAVSSVNSLYLYRKNGR